MATAWLRSTPKMAMVRQVLRRLRRPFLCNPAVTLERKCQVLQSIVLAKGMHLAGCWPLLLPREQRRLHKALMEMVRSVAQLDLPERRATDAEVISATGVLRPQRLVTLMRLQLAIRLAERAQSQLLVLLFWAKGAQRSWIKALESDFALISTAPCCAELRDASVAQWFRLFRSHPVDAKRMVMKAVGQVNEPTIEEAAALRPCTVHCYECGESQLDRQALAVHLVRAHGIKRPLRAYVIGLDCLVCGVRFVSRQRLVDHLSEKSPVCGLNYRIRYRPLAAEEVERLDVEARSEFSRRRRLDGGPWCQDPWPFPASGRSGRGGHSLAPPDGPESTMAGLSSSAVFFFA